MPLGDYYFVVVAYVKLSRKIPFIEFAKDLEFPPFDFWVAMEFLFVNLNGLEKGNMNDFTFSTNIYHLCSNFFPGKER